MEKWQQMALAEVLEVDFTKQEAQIKNAFMEICSPLEGTDGIEVDENFIIIGDRKFELSITADSIKIIYNTQLRGVSECYYIVNSNKQEGYHFASKYRVEYKPLTSIYFDYKTILNNLMNYAIEQN